MIYRVTVNSKNSSKIHIGSIGNIFKERHRNHKTNDILLNLLENIWILKDSGTKLSKDSGTKLNIELGILIEQKLNLIIATIVNSVI